MTSFAVGQSVKIPCEVQRGAFPHEVLVTFTTAQGPISGFVRSDTIVGRHDHQGFIPAIIQAVSQDTITAVVKGSFFTTTGLIYLKRDWADANLQRDRQVA